MMEESAKLVSLGMPTQLALEVARQIVEGGSTEGLVRLGVPSSLAAEIARQIDTGGGDVLDPLRLVARGMPTQLAIEVARQIEEGSGSSILEASPRLGMIGPSTVAHNLTATNTSSIVRGGWNSAGPVLWANALGGQKMRIWNEFNLSDTYGRFYTGDQAGQGGLTYTSWQSMIDYLGARFASLPASERWAFYELGRNDLTVSTTAAHMAAMAGHIASLRSYGFSRILVAKLWNRHTSAGGVWASGGAARAQVSEINAAIVSTYGAASDITIVDFPAFMHDSGSADANPLLSSVRADFTHFTSKGAKLGGKAILAAMGGLVATQAYPDATTISLEGTGGTKTGVTGSVYNGCTATVNGTAITAVASTVTVEGKPYQRFVASGLEAVASTGSDVQFSIPVIAATSGQRLGVRCKVKIPVTQALYGFYAALEGGNAAVGGRSYLLSMNRGDVQTNEVTTGVIGANIAAATEFDGTEAQDLWLETTLPVTASGNVSFVARAIFKAGTAAGQTFQFDIGEIQVYAWPV